MTSHRTASYPSLHERVVFVSGGASGIGAEFVAQFHAQGAKVAFVDRDGPSGARLAERLGSSRVDGATPPLFVECDITDTAALRRSIDVARGAFGPIAALINNAANDQRRAFDQVTPEFWDHGMAVNLRHQFFAAQAVADDMASLGGGSIINLGSTGWMIKVDGYPAYATAKSAVHGLTRALARELGKRRIRVNALVPGWVMTERQLQSFVTPESERQIDANQCLPGRVLPVDLAAMALFLAADDSRMCTAQNFIVDAGWI